MLFEESWSHFNINILETSKRRDDMDEKQMNVYICLRRECRKQDGPVGEGIGWESEESDQNKGINVLLK